MTIMFWLIICFVTFSIPKCNGIIQGETLAAFSRQFRAPQPLPLSYNSPKETKIALIKSMSEKGLNFDFIQELQYSKDFLLVISRYDGLLDGNEKINIDQQIYFLTPSLDIYEKYTINNQLIHQKLGHFVDGMYIPEELIEQNFLKRRQNFHGSKLIALTLYSNKRYIEIENHKNAPYFPSNETYDVTGLVKGAILEIWTILQNNLNFTTKIYSRMDNKWGVPMQHSNGSISVPNGIIKDGMDGLADILLAELAITNDRYLVIDYLVPLYSNLNGIFVKKNSIQESFDFEVFYKPFDKWTWTVLISSSFILTISIVLTSKFLNHQNLTCHNFMDIFAKSLKANLGNASFTPITNQFHSEHIAIFVALMTGNVIWIAYNGALLSKLIEPRFEKPFHDLESLAESNYR